MGDTKNKSGCLCKEHSGFKARILNIENANKSQWTEINGMKKFIVWILVTCVFTMAGMVANLFIALAGKPCP